MYDRLLKKRNLIIAVIIFVAIIILFLPVNIPFRITVTGKVVAGQGWLLSRQTDGSLMATLSDNVSHATESYMAFQMERGDVYQFGMKSGLKNMNSIVTGDTAGYLFSNELFRDLKRLEGRLEIAKSYLDVVSTGERETIIREAQDQFLLNRERSLVQNEILERFGLPTSWGVASNKLVAKIATEVGKPGGLIVVPPGDQADFLAPLPVAMLWGVGPKTGDRLAELGVRTIGDLAALPADRLVRHFGARGQELATRALGIDDRPVIEDHEARSMSAENTFSKDVKDGQELRRSLRHLSERVGTRLRGSEVAGRTIRIKLRWPDFSTITRQTRLDNPTDQDGEIYRSALLLFEKAWRKGRAVRLLGVAVADLGPPIRQLRLFDRSWEQDGRLLRALDDIKARYGRHAVRRGGRKRRHAEDQKQGTDRVITEGAENGEDA